MEHIRRFNENTQSNKNVITRENEMNVISYQIPNSDDFILGRTPDKGWVVQTADGVMIYSTSEMEETYYLDLIESNLERLTWPS